MEADWTVSTDGAGLRAYHVGWSASETPDVASLATIAPTAGRHQEYRAGDLQTLYAHVVVEDTNGNRTMQTRGPIYVDGPATPDLVGTFEQQDWTESGASLVGEDRERSRVAEAGSTLTATQQLFTSWNQDVLRMQWRGADWDTDGDLFIYLDTADGGATKAFNPFGAAADITLPTDMTANYVVWVRGSASAQLLHWTGSAWGENRDLGPNA